MENINFVLFINFFIIIKKKRHSILNGNKIPINGIYSTSSNQNQYGT